MEYINKIVDFSYCNKCIYKNKKESEEPCDECLATPSRQNSIKPLYFKERKSKTV